MFLRMSFCSIPGKKCSKPNGPKWPVWATKRSIHLAAAISSPTPDGKQHKIFRNREFLYLDFQ